MKLLLIFVYLLIVLNEHAFCKIKADLLLEPGLEALKPSEFGRRLYNSMGGIFGKRDDLEDSSPINFTQGKERKILQDLKETKETNLAEKKLPLPEELRKKPHRT